MIQLTQSKLALFLFTTLFLLETTEVRSQDQDAEEKLACLLISDADFPKRYAVQCDFEYIFNDDAGLVLYRSCQHFARDSTKKISRVIANQQSFLDFVLQKQQVLNVWIGEDGVEWSPGPVGDQWVVGGAKLLPVFDPKNVVVSRPEFMEETMGPKTVSSVLEGRECVSSYQKNGVLVSKWSLRDSVGVNRITVLKNLVGNPGPPEEILSMRSIKGGWTPEKDRESDRHYPVRRIIDWWQASDTVWVPRKVRTMVRIKDRDCEASFVMRWAFGDAATDSVFEDPRGKKLTDVFSKIKFEECPSVH